MRAYRKDTPVGRRTAGKSRKTTTLKGRIFVISGPSGSGKTTLAEALLKDTYLKRRLVRSVSFTTRPRRTGERAGRDYFFITTQEFRRNLADKKILESTKYLGYYYGTPKRFVEGQLKNRKSVLLCLDYNGARRLKRLYPRHTVTIFVMPSSLEALSHRIRGRCSKTAKEEIRQRLLLAKKELLRAKAYDYRLVNEELPVAIGGLRTIVLAELKKAEATT